jgi:hypothetical protein
VELGVDLSGFGIELGGLLGQALDHGRDVDDAGEPQGRHLAAR